MTPDELEERDFWYLVVSTYKRTNLLRDEDWTRFQELDEQLRGALARTHDIFTLEESAEHDALLLFDDRNHGSPRMNGARMQFLTMKRAAALGHGPAPVALSANEVHLIYASDIGTTP